MVLGIQLCLGSMLAPFTYVCRPPQGSTLLAATGEACSSDCSHAIRAEHLKSWSMFFSAVDRLRLCDSQSNEYCMQSGGDRVSGDRGAEVMHAINCSVEDCQNSKNPTFRTITLTGGISNDKDV